MSRAALALLAVLAAGPAAAAEKLGVISVAEAPGGPDANLAELTHQLRAACRDRVGGVEEVATMRARLLGQGSSATLSELDRAYGGALAVYQNGEFESSARTLRAIVEDLEALPEGEEAHFQWKRALLRLAYAAASLGQDREVEAVLTRLARTDPGLQPDPDQYPPSFRRRFEELKSRVRALPRRRLHVTSEGKPGTVFVNGRAMGTTPVTLTLAAGAYRVGGAVGPLHVPSFTVDLEAEDRSVVLDFALAESLRPNSGPGLALAPARRGHGIVRAGAWLGVDRLLVASRVEEGGAQFLLGSIYDVRRGALLREGSVRMVAGGVPSVNLGALASFLLTGQSSREVRERTEAPREIVTPPAVAFDAPWTPPTDVAAVPPPSPAAAAPAVAAAPSAPTKATPAPRPSASSATRPPSSTATPAAAPTSPPASTPTPTPTLTATLPSTSTPSQTALPATTPPSLLPTPETAAAAVARVPAQAREGRGSPSRPWTRPAAIGAGVLAAGLAGLAVQQGMASSSAYDDAGRMLGPDGLLAPGSDPSRYRDLRSRGDAGRRNAFVSAGVAAAFAATAGVLGWMSWDRPAGKTP